MRPAWRWALPGALLCAWAAGPGPGVAPAAPAPARCGQVVERGVLPPWARAGFSDPRPRITHTIGRSGEIAAVLFGYPLLSPPSRVRSNKILWVPRVPLRGLSTLRISAQRMAGARPVGHRVLRSVAGGPGPSIIDLPAAGCWRLTLRWSGRSDQLDLRYRRGPAAASSSMSRAARRSAPRTVSSPA